MKRKYGVARGDEAKIMTGEYPMVADPELDASALLAENEGLEEALALSRRRLEVMRDVAHALAGRLNLDELLHTIVDRISQLLRCDRASLFFIEPETGALWSKVAQGLTPPEKTHTEKDALIRVPAGSGVVGYVAANAMPLNLDEVYSDPRFFPQVDAETGYKTRTLLAMPILDADGKVLGVVEAINKLEGAFTALDERLLEAMADQISVALKNALLYEELKAKAASLESAQQSLKDRVSEMDTLVEIDQALVGTMTADELFSTVVNHATELLEASAASLGVTDPRSGAIQFVAATGDAAPRVLATLQPAQRGLIGQVAGTGKRIVVEDATDDARHDSALAQSLGFHPGPVVVEPLSTQGRTLGALEVLRKRGAPPFTDDDLRILHLLANRSAHMLDLARRREEKQEADQLKAMGKMLAGIVHDFKTPMTVVSGYAQLMADTDEAEVRQDYAETILGQTDAMSAMVGELLEYARGQSQVLLAKTVVSAFMEDVKKQVEQQVAKTEVSLSTEVRYRGTLRLDRVKVSRALANLTKNAIEAMQGKGTLQLVAEQVGDLIEFSVTDSGPGLPSELRGRLFESFATHGKKDGTGLGLAIVKKIVEDHRGEVRVESRPGEGTTFRLRIPL
jgi:signal transduction histidine kinase